MNRRDANIAIDLIVNKVRQNYAPYDLNIIIGDQDSHQHMLTDRSDGDVLVMVTGGSDFLSGNSAWGLSPWADLGNERDEIVWDFGGSIANGFTDADRLINAVARVISHEMGHAFGLGHIDASSGGVAETRTHHTMNVASRDWNHDFGFQDITYEADVFDFAFRRSDRNPELNTETQNAHQYLSHRGVLGPSSDPWTAVLSPGTLTLSGSNSADHTWVTDSGDGDIVVRDDLRSYIVDTTATPDGVSSINPPYFVD